MRRLLCLIAALSALALQVHALTPEQRTILLGNPAASRQRPPAVAILSNGWQATLTFKATTCAGVTSAYAPTPDATPKLTLNVTSAGFTTAGAATTISRSVVMTRWLRQAYSNQTLPVETQSGSDCITTVTLSDFVNNTDTATATFLSGLYTSGAAVSPAATGAPVTNGSTTLHAVPICNWVTPGYQVYQPGAESAGAVEVACFHARMQGGKQVQAVKIIWSDGTHTASCIATTMVQSTIITTGNPVYVYHCAPANGDFAALTGGLITRDFIAYPIVGDQVTQASLGQDGANNIAATALTPNLHALQDEWDSVGNKYSPVYGWISTTGTVGTCATNACISTSSTDPGTGAAANYATFYTFANNCKSYNNANRGHNDTAGCVGLVRANTAINGFDSATNLSTLTVGNTWLKFQAAPGESATTVIVSRASSSTGTATVANRTWFEGIGFTQLDSTSSAYNEEIVAGDTTAIATEIVLNNFGVTEKVSSAIPLFFRVGFKILLNGTGSMTGVLGALAPFGTQPDAAFILGGAYNASPIAAVWCYECLGVQGVNVEILNPSNGSANYVQATGRIEAFNTVFKSAVPISEGGGVTAANVANVQNIYEKTTVDASFAERVYADGDTTQITNYLDAYNTVVGGRWNWMYNETTTICTVKQGVRLYDALDPMTGQGFNIKTDTTTASGISPNGARICDWVDRYGVGSIGAVALGDALADNSVPGPVVWISDYFGRTGSTTPNNVGYGRTIAWTANASASGTNAGSGNYLPTGGAASPAYGRVPTGLAGLPKDIAGTTRRNDGTGCAGAYEC